MFIVILTDGELGAISRETVYYMRRPFRIITCQNFIEIFASMFV